MITELDRTGNDTDRANCLQSPSGSSVLTSQATASPSKVNMPSRKQRNQPSSRVHDIEFATEISTSLLAQVRQLQAALAERDEALKNANLENSRLELEAEGFAQRLRALDESEQRYKDENWSLETQKNELMAQVKEAQEREAKLTSALSALTAEKGSIERELEELKQANTKLLEDQAAAQKAHDSEANMLRRSLHSGDAERVSLQAKVEELTSQNQELVKAITAMRARQMEAETPRRPTVDTSDVIRDEPSPDEDQPPSPNKQTPRHNHLETETLRSSLGHAHRMIQNLKSNIHREKTEKLELKRMLQEARDELEARRRADHHPTTPNAAKRPKVRAEAFKRPVPRSDLLGPARRGRTSILDEPDWEDHTSEASPTRTIRSNRAGSRSPPTTTDQSDVYQTATENDDTFETANERETATESEAFQTGLESMADDDDTDELTETENQATPRRGSLRARRVPSQLRIAKTGDRSSYMSTASSSDSEPEGARTPVQSPPPRYRLKVNRGAIRRIRPSGEAPMASSFHDPSSAGESPAGSFQHAPATPMAGQSLFAELEDLGSPGSDGDFGSPLRTGNVISQPSTPRPNTISLDQELSEVAAPPTVVMVDSSTMTDPWEPTTPVTTRTEESHIVTPSLVDSSTQYTPLKPHEEPRTLFPTPPKTIWDESSAPDASAPEEPPQTPVQVRLDVSDIMAEETVPIAPAAPPAPSLSSTATQTMETESVVAEQPEEEPVVVNVTPEPEPEPVRLSLSTIYSEQTEPTPFVTPEPKPVVVEPEETTRTALPLSVSSIAAVFTEPAAPAPAETEKEIPELSISPIQSAETAPVDPVWPEPKPVEATAVPDETTRPGTAVLAGGRALGVKEETPAIFVDQEEQKEPAAAEPPAKAEDAALPLNSISGNAASRDVKSKSVVCVDQGAQTILSSKQIDQLLLDRLASRPLTPSEPRSIAGVDSPGATPKASKATPSLGSGAAPTSHPVTRRPGSSSSARPGSAGGSQPPLRADYKETIAAAQNSQTTGTMGPPTAPASAMRSTATRPKTPSEHRAPSLRESATQVRSSRESRASTRRSSLSSFASELDVRFNIQSEAPPSHPGPGTDPRMIQAITQTMIGEYLWKYTRRTVSGEMSNTRHRRYFWVHPYTRTLYWSEHDPSVAGRSEHKAKSVQIEAVRVVADDNPYPPGLHRKSLEVVTPGRRIRFTAATSQRHETWYNALSYLLLRTDDEQRSDEAEITNDDIEEFNPRPQARRTVTRVSQTSHQSGNTATSKNKAPSTLSVRPGATPGRVSPALSGTGSRTENHRASASSRLSRVFDATIRGSFASIRGRHTPVHMDSSQTDASDYDSAEDLRQVIERKEWEADRLENVRACCDGKYYCLFQ